MPSTDDMLMMEPPPESRIAGIALRVPRKTPSALTAMICRQVSSETSAMGSARVTPALLTRMSSRPCSDTKLSTVACQAASSVTSRGWNRAVPPAAAMESATAWPRVSSRPVTSTAAPSSAMRTADAAPSPLVAPVTIATLSASLAITRLIPREGIAYVAPRMSTHIELRVTLRTIPSQALPALQKVA